MKKKVVTFKVGDRVGLATSDYDNDYGDSTTGKLRYSEDETPEYGVITDVLSSGQVLVKWDNEWYGKYNTDAVAPSTLLPEATLKEVYSKLEEEFDAQVKVIKLKMKEAGKLVREANKLAKKTGHDLSEMYDAVNPLVDAMDASGWRSSSWGC